MVITLGYRCNFSCAHCCVADKKEVSLSPAETERVIRTINEHRIGQVLFIGGEPTLYLREIGHILSRLVSLPQVRLTTNGHFAKTRAEAIAVLSGIPGLAGVNLSYDSFHKRFLAEEKLIALKDACGEMGLEFKVFLALRSPLDLVLLHELRAAGVKNVVLQKLLPSGAAKKEGMSFLYPSFDEGVLEQNCPNKGNILYLCGQGFTSCCSNLVFNNDSKRFSRKTLGGYLNSDFFKLTSSCTFREYINRFRLKGLNFMPEHSSPCVLCEYIFRSKFGERL